MSGKFDEMGVPIPNPDKPVTRGEVAAYVADVIVAERRRIAQAIMELGLKNREDLAEAIADSRLDPDVFGWSD
jgi:hypothetical protein